MKLYIAPEALPLAPTEPVSLFLAGSIEQDKATNWQDRVINELAQYPVSILNPRRAQWDASWVQSHENTEFHKQVTWELDGIEAVDIQFFYFEPGTMSPITLMELGYVAGAWRVAPEIGIHAIVVCPEGFWRRGNVQIMCARAGFLCVDSIEEGLHVLKQTICDLSRSSAH